MRKLSKNRLNTEVVPQMNDKTKEWGKSVDNEKVTGEDILFSLKPLFDEYFVGTVSCNNNALTYKTVTGQSFIIDVKEEL